MICSSASTKSIALILMITGKSAPHFFLMLWMTSQANLALFSGLPPYSSVRRLVYGDMNCVIR